MTLVQPSTEERRRRPGLVALIVAIAGLLVTLVVVIGAILWQQPAVLQQVNAEIEAIRLRGEPIEPQDLATLCPLSPADAKRLEEWLHLCTLGEPLNKYTDEVKPLPLIGEPDVPDDALSQLGAEALREQARAYLAKHDAAVQLAHQLARHPGPVEYPRKLDEGFNAKLPWILALRSLSSAVSLELRLRAAEGDVEGAFESWTVMLAIAESMRPTSCGVSSTVVQAMYFGIINRALRQAEFLVNDGRLSDELLLKVRDLLLSVRPERDLKQVLLGERIMGYMGFLHPEQILDDAAPEKSPQQNLKARANDCLLYLRTMRDLLELCDLPFPECRLRAEKTTLAAIGDAVTTQDEWKAQFAGTCALLPGAVGLGFAAPAETIAGRDIMLVAIACRQFARQRGRLPTSLGELPQDFLQRVPSDPYSGDPLLVNPSDRGLFIYSVGQNGSNDGGVNDPRVGDISFEVLATGGP
jgi:hypothetical protein